VKFGFVIEVDTEDDAVWVDDGLTMAEWMDGLQEEYLSVASMLIDLADYPNTSAVVRIESNGVALERVWKTPEKVRSTLALAPPPGAGRSLTERILP
jgi:hypothetical protein